MNEVVISSPPFLSLRQSHFLTLFETLCVCVYVCLCVCVCVCFGVGLFARCSCGEIVACADDCVALIILRVWSVSFVCEAQRVVVSALSNPLHYDENPKPPRRRSTKCSVLSF